MTEKIRPLHDRVLVKRLEEDQMTAGGIIIPDTAKEKTQLGTIVSIGTGKINNDGSLRKLAVKEGDKVLFGKFSGTEVKVGSEEYLVLKEEELLGVLSA